MQSMPSVIPASISPEAAGCEIAPGAGLLVDVGVGVDAEAAGEGAEADWTRVDECESRIGPRR